ncbi:MAG TPA: TetR/AcrR family transcriptional regulator [Tahibacter sp.]|nr:TetR/AcrR family transcriptional regulator [Tahibacter sp.]
MASSRSDSQSPYSPKALEIIQRTNELLASGGYNGFSYADIAVLVDVRKASIHHHFPTKADLVKATVVLHREATRRGLAALNDAKADPLERLVAYCHYWAECIAASNPPICICAMLAAELPSVPADVAAEVKGHFADLHAWIAANLAQGQSQGSLRLADSPSTDASVFMAAIHGAMLTARAAGDASLFRSVATMATDRLQVK